MEQSIYRVIELPYGAAGDGVTNDRAAIQAAIDDAYKNGGGKVILEGGKTFLSSGLVIRTGVELHFEDDAVLLQESDPMKYVKPAGDAYEPYVPVIGHNFSETIKWSHTWYLNYPMLFAPEGAHDFKITGKGTLYMMPGDDGAKVIRICPVGFYRVHDFEVSDLKIRNYHGYAMMPFTCENGLFKNLDIREWSFGNGDGICLMNCRNIRITGCNMYTGDDSVYIFSSYKDPRKSEWWNSDEPQASENIEIDHNDLASNHCKAFGMILWGIECPDLEKTEVRNVYVHNNHFKTMGNWNYNPYTVKGGHPPVTGMRFENNVIDGIEMNFFETVVTDMNCFRSAEQFMNGGFEDGRCFWSMRGENAGVCREDVGQDGKGCGYISGFDKEDSAVYQGLFVRSGKPCIFRAKVRSSGVTCRMFVKDMETQELIACRDFFNTEWEDMELTFTVPVNGNYHIGIERGKAQNGYAYIDNAMLMGNCEAALDYDNVIFDRGKIIYQYK